MLIGSVNHGVDAKGRIFIPAKWRKDLGTTVIVTHGILGREDVRCLFGMSIEAFKAFGTRFESAPETDMLLQDFRRVMYQNAAECELDKQGRILLPSQLRLHADIDQEAVLLGVDTRIEIWNAQALEKQNKNVTQNYGQNLQYLAGKGI
ncbi:division/cell wall cluster transcriptional repressor MraZ [Christensenellaceae bacterium OttesenSCG-928-M15]|nr:division/cell wall cluster transcriptional repressor MraZ [Christensenellaceae bacterium OttesenSCG-928-M15]